MEKGCLAKVAKLRQSLNQFRKEVRATIHFDEKSLNSLGKTLDEKVQAIADQNDRKNQQLRQENKHLVAEVANERRKRQKVQTELNSLVGAIRVFCRIRPVLTEEQQQQERVHFVSEQQVDVVSSASSYDSKNQAKNTQFHFDRVFHHQTTQTEMFDEVCPMVESAVEGYHSCIFAYGQTGAGKTYSMEGSELHPGISYSAVNYIFQRLKEREFMETFRVSLQMVEIYNENVYDLLYVNEQSEESNDSSNCANQDPTRKLVEIRHSAQGVYLQNTTTVNVSNAEQVFQQLRIGKRNRSIYATKMNVHSSRSHSVLLINIDGKNNETDESTNGRLVLVDLAGSERLSRTEATGDRLKEAQNINKSLSAIGDVMSALLSKEKHIPFRNSKLTHLLQDSLGNNNKVLMLVHVSPTEDSVSETICSLNFASRVSQIQLGEAKKKKRNSIEVKKYKELILKLETKLREEHIRAKKEIELRKQYQQKLMQYQSSSTNRKLNIIAENSWKEDGKENSSNDNALSLRRSPRLIRPNEFNSNSNSSSNNISTSSGKRKKSPVPLSSFKSILKKPKAKESAENQGNETKKMDSKQVSFQVLKPAKKSQAKRNRHSLAIPASTRQPLTNLSSQMTKRIRRSDRIQQLNQILTLANLNPTSSLGPASRVIRSSANTVATNTGNAIFSGVAGRVPTSSRKPKWV